MWWKFYVKELQAISEISHLCLFSGHDKRFQALSALCTDAASVQFISVTKMINCVCLCGIWNFCLPTTEPIQRDVHSGAESPSIWAVILLLYALGTREETATHVVWITTVKPSLWQGPCRRVFTWFSGRRSVAP